jgi:hypothetical protein
MQVGLKKRIKRTANPYLLLPKKSTPSRFANEI